MASVTFPKELFAYIAEFAPPDDAKEVYDTLNVDRYNPSIISGLLAIGIDPAILLAQARARKHLQRKLVQEFALIELLYSTGIKWGLVCEEGQLLIGFDTSETSILPDNFEEEIVRVSGLEVSSSQSSSSTIFYIWYHHPWGHESKDPDLFDRVNIDDYIEIVFDNTDRLYRNLVLADRLYLELNPALAKQGEIIIENYHSHGRSCPMVPGE